MGRPFRTSRPHVSRSLYSVRWRIAIIIFIVAIFELQNQFLVHRRSLAAKYSATRFRESEEVLMKSFTPDEEDIRFHSELLANRRTWKVLGRGWEGKVFTYGDAVIKTFITGRSPFRNCEPGAAEKWPTEIMASLTLGGVVSRHGESEQKTIINTTIEGLLPVSAYFRAAFEPSYIPEWHLVTPLINGGNLAHLAKSVRDAEGRMYRDIDVRYRPAFERLLITLQHLHTAGYCHDDVKPANIFVQDDTRWLLGDLGNLRNVDHPYHSSKLWIDNDQFRDCRANDAMRALKSYLNFVRTAAIDGTQFDEDFFQGQQSLSRLYWRAAAISQSLSAASLHDKSRAESPAATYPSNNQDLWHIGPPRSLLNLYSSRWAQERVMNRALQTRVSERLARWWAMTWLFGVPVSESCGV